MIDEHPDGADLLEAARALFESLLLPDLGKQQRHAGRMIMRAMDLAMRELRAGVKPLADELASLDALFDGMAQADDMAQADGKATPTPTSTSKAKSKSPAGRASTANPRDQSDRVDRHVDEAIERLDELNRRLVDDIRSGRLDPGTPNHAAAFAHLRAVAHARLRRSNPRLLNPA